MLFLPLSGYADNLIGSDSYQIAIFHKAPFWVTHFSYEITALMTCCYGQLFLFGTFYSIISFLWRFSVFGFAVSWVMPSGCFGCVSGVATISQAVASLLYTERKTLRKKLSLPSGGMSFHCASLCIPCASFYFNGREELTVSLMRDCQLFVSRLLLKGVLQK